MMYLSVWLLFLAVLISGKKSDKSIPVPASTPAFDPLSEVVCEESEEGYIVPDPHQCDRYVECTPRAKAIIRLCPDGYALDLQNGVCDLGHKVNCEGRVKLQAATGDGLCPRLNGNFPLPAEVSCTDYVDCREGQPFQMSCGHGAVFDATLGCVHPDQTNRAGCTATDVLGFRCPAAGTDTTFGDHQRLPHPTDCGLFYACLSSGFPRLLGCEKPKVFNPATGLCDNQKHVEGCENTYPDEPRELDLEAERSKLEAEIRAELEEKFGLRPSAKQKTTQSTTTTASTPPVPLQRTEVRTAVTSRTQLPTLGQVQGGQRGQPPAKEQQGQRGQQEQRGPQDKQGHPPAKDQHLKTRIASYDSAPAFVGPRGSGTSSTTPTPSTAAASDRFLRPLRPLLFSKAKAGL